jgi:hypothetical protein
MSCPVSCLDVSPYCLHDLVLSGPVGGMDELVTTSGSRHLGRED